MIYDGQTSFPEAPGLYFLEWNDEEGGLEIIEVIHEADREFFLRMGDGDLYDVSAIPEGSRFYTAPLPSSLLDEDEEGGESISDV